MFPILSPAFTQPIASLSFLLSKPKSGCPTPSVAPSRKRSDGSIAEYPRHLPNRLLKTLDGPLSRSQ
ncbi:hypothetical protein TNCV_2807881 [Trichonephila clavipes]|nr:hypothetical protein TNCV_2807881 [Trichonephila clavipes]